MIDFSAVVARVIISSVKAMPADVCSICESISVITSIAVIVSTIIALEIVKIVFKAVFTDVSVKVFDVIRSRAVVILFAIFTPEDFAVVHCSLQARLAIQVAFNAGVVRIFFDDAATYAADFHFDLFRHFKPLLCNLICGGIH